MAVSIGIAIGVLSMVAAAEEKAPEIALSRSVAAFAGNTLDVTVRIEQNSEEPVLALGCVEYLPEGWEFDGVVADTKPGIFIAPALGSTALLEFVWLEVPSFPVVFTYRVYTGGTGGTILGQTIYRYSGPAETTPALLSTISNSGLLESAPSQSLSVSLTPLGGGLGLRSVSDCPVHTADQDADYEISVSELLRIAQFFNSGGFHCQSGTEDGYAPYAGDESCAPHDSDYHPSGPDWEIDLTEMTRISQFYNSDGYRYDHTQTSEDGYLPGKGEIPVAADVLSNTEIDLTCGVDEALTTISGKQAYTMYVKNDEATTCSTTREVDALREALCEGGTCASHDYTVELMADYAYRTTVPEPDSPPGSLQYFSVFCTQYINDRQVDVEFSDPLNSSRDGTFKTLITCTSHPNEIARADSFASK